VSVRMPRSTERKYPGFFVEWRRQWSGPSAKPMTPLDFVAEQKAFSYVVAAAWLFCPETVEYRGCLFLQDRFDQAKVDTWLGHLTGSQADVEAMVNQTKLYDVFANSDLDDHEEDLETLAFAVGECWQGVLATRYPERGVIVEVSGEEDGSYGPVVTFWTIHTGDRGTR
jgi:hypothetical protein